jgi:hypothetical protein
MAPGLAIVSSNLVQVIALAAVLLLTKGHGFW